MVRIKARGTIVAMVLLLILGLWIAGIIPKQIGKIAANNYVQTNHGELGLILVRMDFSAAHGGYFAVFKDGNGEVYNFLMHSKLLPITVLYDPLNTISFETKALSQNQTFLASEQNYGDIKEYTLDMSIENGDVVWTPRGIHNLEKLDTFVANVQGKVPDRIRVVGFTREGDPIISDVEYDGATIELTNDSTRDKFSARPTIEVSYFSHIIIEKRYSGDFGGYFTDYLLKCPQGNDGGILAQIFEME